MAEADPIFASIGELGAAYRTRRLSPVEVTKACLERIARFNPALNAFLTVLDDSALAAARIAEQEIAAGRDRGALHGVPVALKDLVDVAGVPSKYGSHASFADHPAKDALLVSRLREAGAVILGKTNLLEFAYGAVHPDVGQTNNPWDPRRTSGGSSGGSGAGVAAGLCYAALGTDTGGSIRGPAAYCGVAGLKPTYGLVPLDGVYPLSWSLDHAGPLARSSADAAALLGVLAGRDVTLQTLDAGSLRLGVIRQHVEAPAIRPDIRLAFEDTCAWLRAAGARFESFDLPELDMACDALLMVLLPEAAVVHAERLGRDGAAFGPQTRAQIEQGFLVPAVSYVRGQQYRRRLAAALGQILAKVDAIVSPTVPWVAPAEDPAVNDAAGFEEMRFVAPYNLTGMPALSVRCGTGESGLPVGLQIAGPLGGDGTVLAIGALIETMMAAARPPRFA
jgi:aspartyl-tRNA(Asn)/glutamyl-tRNA(Gln) amidotransferase subunit A